MTHCLHETAGHVFVACLTTLCEGSLGVTLFVALAASMP